MRFLVPVLFAALALAGCLGNEPVDDFVLEEEPPVVLDAVLPVEPVEALVFEKSIVDAAVAFGADLYEPTIDVSPDGVIYIAGHTILVDTTGAPAFFSKDDGQTWEQLPFAGPAQMPANIHGGTPPPSDEIFIVAGDDGWAYGVDITLATFPVNAWSGDGAEHAYHNPNAYNRVDSTTQCQPLSLNDRPWAAYANGTLLMVNNPGGGHVQVGAMQVPPAMPVGVGAPVVGPTWNTCAGNGGGYIPGIPDLREDGRFAVPQIQGDSLVAVVGNAADVLDVEQVEVFKATNAGSITSTYGHAAFDAAGSLFVGMANNTYDEQNGRREARDGQFKLALSQDGGLTFSERTFTTEGIVQSFYMDGDKNGTGALVAWAVPGEEDGRSDWYIGHAEVGPDGAPVLEGVGLAIDEGPRPSAHVTGAALGPDGRAYLAAFEGAPLAEYAGSTPLSVYIQV